MQTQPLECAGAREQGRGVGQCEILKNRCVWLRRECKLFPSEVPVPQKSSLPRIACLVSGDQDDRKHASEALVTTLHIVITDCSN
jgi:hypothetical protein